MYIATCVMALGYTRVNGLIAYNQSDKSFSLITPARARKMIDSDELKGVRWVKNNETDLFEFTPDKEGWNLGNIMVLSGLTYRPWKEDYSSEVQNTIYSVVKVTEGEEKTFEIVSNTFQRLDGISEQQVRELASITEVGGIVIDEDDNIHILDGVVVEKKVEPVAAQADTEKPVKKEKVSRCSTDTSETKASGTKRKATTKKK